jgi:drug/metabolite transporter superfamily protein YnfA
VNLALYIHLLGTMTLFGAALTALVTSLAGLPGPTVRALLVAVPAWVVALVGGHWLQHDLHLEDSNATWLQLGRNILEPGVLVLLLAVFASWWWVRSANPRAGRVTASLSGIYIALLAVAWLAMSGKWS